MLHHTRATGDTSVANGYLIHLPCFQTSITTTTFWQLQAAIISQLQLIRLLSIIITTVRPDHGGRSVKTFSSKLKLSSLILSSTDVHFPELGDTIAASCLVITAVDLSCALTIEPMLLKHPPPVPPHPLGEFVWKPFNWKEHAISLAPNNANFVKQDTQLKASTQSSNPTKVKVDVVLYTIHPPDTNELVTAGSEVISLDGLCPAFNACPNPNIFQHYFGVKFHHKGHSYVQAISPTNSSAALGSSTR
jgi:hypothetical protein